MSRKGTKPKNEGPRDIGIHKHGFRHKKFYLWQSIVVVVSYLVHYDTLLQNATDITTKCNSYFIANCEKNLLQDASGDILQNNTVIV